MTDLAITLSLFAAWLSGIGVGLILVKTNKGESA